MRAHVRLCLLLPLFACSSDARDLLTIEPPTFGAGMARIHIALGSGYVEDSLEVFLDSRRVRDAFTVGEEGATAVVALVPHLYSQLAYQS